MDSYTNNGTKSSFNDLGKLYQKEDIRFEGKLDSTKELNFKSPKLKKSKNYFIN